MPKGNLLSLRCPVGQRQVCKRSKCLDKQESDRYRFKQKMITSAQKANMPGATKRQKNHRVGGNVPHGRVGSRSLRSSIKNQLRKTEAKHGRYVAKALRRRLARTVKGSRASNRRIFGRNVAPESIVYGD